MKKKALSLALALALCLGLTVPAFAASNDFVIENGTLIKYNGSARNVTVPSNVTKIGDSVFAHHEEIQQITIPDGVTEIGKYAFTCCMELHSLQLPSALTTVGFGAFSDSGLKSITIPSSASNLENGIFSNCYLLTDVVFSDGATKIGIGMFWGCDNLSTVTIPASVTSIGEDAFDLCDKMTIHGAAGSYAETYAKASNIPFAADLPSVTPGETPSAESDFLISENGKLLAYDGKASKVVIPSSVKEISSGMFDDCDFLEEVTIPSSVTKIGTICFYNCKNLKTVNMPSGLTDIGTYSFWETPWLKSLGDFATVNGVLLAYQGKDKDITIPENVSSIGNAVFNGYSLNSVTLSKNTRRIGNGAFADCKSLTSITIPAGLTYIGWEAFVSSNSLKDIYYGGSEAQWKAITMEEGNDVLKSATIHYNSGADTPVIEVENIPASGTALASTQTVTVDGKAVEFQMYALADANGNLTNYIKLRDMAYVLNGTKAQFSVGYDGIISLTKGQPYEAGGTEMATPFSGDRAYTGGAQTLKIDGKDVAMTAITLTDDNGGGYNYFKLRDLGKALGFNVSWDNGVIVESNKPYVG